MKAKLALAALAATFLSLPATAGGTCLRQDQIYNWNALDDRTLIVEDDLHKKFKLSLMTPCEHLQFHERLGFKVFGGTALSCVTRGDDVISGSEIGPQHCPIKSVEPYTPEMEKADKDAKAAKDAVH